MSTETGQRDLKDILAQIGDQSHPPVHLWHPQMARAIDMRIARDGRWFYMGSEIQRPAMVKLFSTVLRHEPDGSHVLVTPVEKLTIDVEDAPFLVVEADLHGVGEGQSISFRTNVDELLVAGPDHPIRVEEDPESGAPAPYVLVRDGLWALMSRPVFYQLVEAGIEIEQDGAKILAVWSGGQRFSLGAVD